MIAYGLVNQIEQDIAETNLLETFMHIISEIPEDEIWSYSVYEKGEDGTLIIQQSFHEWLFDFVGRPF